MTALFIALHLVKENEAPLTLIQLAENLGWKLEAFLWAGGNLVLILCCHQNVFKCIPHLLFRDKVSVNLIQNKRSDLDLNFLCYFEWGKSC